MPIVSSQVVEDQPRIDGRRSIRERHLDQFGVDHSAQYLKSTIPIGARA